MRVCLEIKGSAGKSGRTSFAGIAAWMKLVPPCQFAIVIARDERG
jgi:hypothetical protein